MVSFLLLCCVNSLVFLCSLTLCVLFKEFVWTFATNFVVFNECSTVVELSRMVGILVNIWTVPYFSSVAAGSVLREVYHR